MQGEGSFLLFGSWAFLYINKKDPFFLSRGTGIKFRIQGLGVWGLGRAQGLWRRRYTSLSKATKAGRSPDSANPTSEA